VPPPQIIIYEVLDQARVNTSKSREWNEVDEMFSLMDFYYLLIMSAINTNFSEKECDAIQSDNMVDRL